MPFIFIRKKLVKYFYKKILLASMNVFVVHNKSSLFLLLEFFQIIHLIITILPYTSNTQIKTCGIACIFKLLKSN